MLDIVSDTISTGSFNSGELNTLEFLILIYQYFVSYIVPFLIFIFLCLINCKLKKILISLKKDNEI